MPEPASLPVSWQASKPMPEPASLPVPRQASKPMPEPASPPVPLQPSQGDPMLRTTQPSDPWVAQPAHAGATAPRALARGTSPLAAFSLAPLMRPDARTNVRLDASGTYRIVRARQRKLRRAFGVIALFSATAALAAGIAFAVASAAQPATTATTAEPTIPATAPSGSHQSESVGRIDRRDSAP
jgi:hypothetical protein